MAFNDANIKVESVLESILRNAFEKIKANPDCKNCPVFEKVKHALSQVKERKLDEVDNALSIGQI